MLDTFVGLIVSATLLTVAGLSLGGLLAMVAAAGGGCLRAGRKGTGPRGQ